LVLLRKYDGVVMVSVARVSAAADGRMNAADATEREHCITTKQAVRMT
jgi:hypothetical protein